MFVKSVKLIFASLAVAFGLAIAAAPSFAATASHQIPDWAVGINSYQ